MCALPGSAAPCNLWGTNMGLLCMCVCVCVCVCVCAGGGGVPRCQARSHLSPSTRAPLMRYARTVWGGGLAALSGSLAPMPKHA